MPWTHQTAFYQEKPLSRATSILDEVTVPTVVSTRTHILRGQTQNLTKIGEDTMRGAVFNFENFTCDSETPAPQNHSRGQGPRTVRAPGTSLVAPKHETHPQFCLGFLVGNLVPMFKTDLYFWYSILGVFFTGGCGNYLCSVKRALFVDFHTGSASMSCLALITKGSESKMSDKVLFLFSQGAHLFRLVLPLPSPGSGPHVHLGCDMMVCRRRSVFKRRFDSETSQGRRSVGF